jgi:monofunctional glycosyltransferase
MIRRVARRRSPWRRVGRIAAGLALAWLLLSLLLVVPLRWLDPSTSSFMLRIRFGGGTVQHQWVDAASISPDMSLAVIAAEDQRFPRHAGFDFTEISRALKAWRAGARLRGASTLSQQVAKNLYLWPTSSWPRKALETWFTLLIELSWPKRRILEVYLNIAQFGGTIFGVEAASRHYFGRPASALSAEQAALLAAVLPAPGAYRVDAPSDHLRARQRWILRQMSQLGGPAYLRNL